MNLNILHLAACCRSDVIPAGDPPDQRRLRFVIVAISALLLGSKVGRWLRRFRLLLIQPLLGLNTMLFEISEEIRRKARNPHELFMFNLAVFHLMLAPVSFFLLRNINALLIPLTCSSLVIAYIFIQGKRLESHGPWYLMVHWKLGFRRATFLMAAYAVTALIITGGWLVTLGIDKHTTRDIVFTVFSRIGIMPTFFLVVLTFVLESGSIYQAGRGEVPDAMLKRFPAPPDIPVRENAPLSEGSETVDSSVS
jgi:hypothetical protein